MITFQIVRNRNGRKVISWQRLFLAFAFINTVGEIIGFVVYFKEGGRIDTALPFIIAAVLPAVILFGGVIYWFSRPVENLPPLGTKNIVI